MGRGHLRRLVGFLQEGQVQAQRKEGGNREARKTGGSVREEKQLGAQPENKDNAEVVEGGGARVRRRVEEGVRGGGGEGKLAIYNRILFIAGRETKKLRNNIIWV